MAQRVLISYRDKLAQTNREAKATVVALAVIVAVWLIGGFGLAGVDVQVFGTPLWIVVGCVGTWVAAMVAAVVLAKLVFVDFSLDDEDECGADASGGVKPLGAADGLGAAEGAGAEGEGALHG